MQRTLPTQLATFTLAMRSAEVILGLPLLHDEKLGRKVPTTQWTGRFQLRPQPLLVRHLLLPNWGQVADIIRDAPEAIAQIAANMTHLTRGMEAWRRWAPAQSWNQPPTIRRLLPKDVPYGGLMPVRRHGKSPPDCWEGARQLALANHGRWRQSEHYHAMFEGGSMGDYLFAWGAVDSDDLRRVIQEAQMIVKRAKPY